MNSLLPPDLSAPRSSAISHALDALASETDTLGVAVSGGSDSLALLLHAHAWAQSRQRSLHAATVDHGLRPEAPAEAAHVASICTGLDIPHQTLRWRPPSPRASQSTARHARYTLLAEWAQANNVSAIALGHTEDDRRETFLIRARAGSGWYGLAGPMPAAPMPVDTPHPLRLIRPALTTSRQELRRRLTAAGIDWIDDPSNAARQFERVRMRQLLAATPPATHAGILRCMNKLAELRSATLAAARNALERHVSTEDGASLIEVAALDSLPHAARLRLIEALLLSHAPKPAPPRADRLARLVDEVATSAPSRRRATLAGCVITHLSDRVSIAPAPPRKHALLTPSPPHPDRRARQLLMDPQTHLLRKEQ